MCGTRSLHTKKTIYGSCQGFFIFCRFYTLKLLFVVTCCYLQGFGTRKNCYVDYYVVLLRLRQWQVDKVSFEEFMDMLYSQSSPQNRKAKSTNLEVKHGSIWHHPLIYPVESWSFMSGDISTSTRNLDSE